MSGDGLDWHLIAEARRVQLERVQGRRLFVRAAAVLDATRRLVGVLRPSVERARSATALVVHSIVALPARTTAGRRERELRAALAALPTQPPRGDVPSAADVTAVIVTAHQPQRLERLLTALAQTGIAAIVVDNAGVEAVASVVAAHPGSRRVRLAAPRSYAEANTIGIAEAATPWVLLLNDDVEPLHERWFDDLRAAVLPADGRPEASAVGAVLVHGRRGPLGGPGVDMTVQHSGIAPVLEGPLVRLEHRGRGDAPRPATGAVDVLAVTGACLLVRRELLGRVGGLHAGFDYGLEDVDLCLRLAEYGPVRVATGAFLLHEEGATRLRGDRATRRRRQESNRRLLDARHGPTLRARVVDAALAEGDPVARPARGLRVDVDGSADASAALGGIGALDVRRARRRADAAGPVLLVVGSGARVPVDAAVPVLGWARDAAEVARWSDALLDACDVIVTGDGDPDGTLAERAPTLPVERLPADADPASVAALVHGVLRRPRWSLRIGAPGGRRGARWGDTPLAGSLRRELRALGQVARVTVRPAWGGPVDRAADVVVTLKGRGVAPEAAPDQTTVVWIISHPSEIAPGELDGADLVLAGSELLADHLRTVTTVPVHTLPQAVDGRRLHAGPRDADRASRVLFLGNSRAVPRPAVMAAVRGGLPLTLIGAGWHRYVDPALVRRTSVPAEELPRWYRSADVVLNDHWDEMRRWGLVSNRVFEVLACGGLVVSDRLPGLDELTDGAVPTYDDPDELVPLVAALLDDPERRATLAERGRAAVHAAHTWQHRAATLVALVEGLPSRSGSGDEPRAEGAR